MSWGYGPALRHKSPWEIIASYWDVPITAMHMASMEDQHGYVRISLDVYCRQVILRPYTLREIVWMAST